MLDKLNGIENFFNAVYCLSDKIADTISKVATQCGPWIGVAFFIFLIFIVNKSKK